MTEPRLPELGLVLTGGGMRAAFGAGVLRALAEWGLTGFQVAQAVSAGAPNLAYFAAGQTEELWDIWWHHLPTPSFIHYRSLLRPPTLSPRRPRLLDTEYLVREVFAAAAPLDEERLERSSIEWLLLATRLGDRGGLSLAAFSRHDGNPLRILQACLALPWASPVSADGRGGRYLDGGLLAPVPIRRGGRPLARRMLVILNRPRRGMKPGRSWVALMLDVGLLQEHRAVEEAVRAEPRLARKAIAALEAEEMRGRVLVVEPDSAPPATLVTRSPRRVRNTVRQGYRTALRRRREIEAFLLGSPGPQAVSG